MVFLKKINCFKKITSTILIVSIFISSSFFILPKKTEAQFGIPQIVFDIPTETATAISAGANVTGTTKDIGLDSIAWFISKVIIRKITAQTVNWINNGFNGNPAYITDPSQFFLNVGDQMANKVISETSLSKLCSPFQAQIRIALVKNYLSETDYSYANTCTLGMIEQNFENFTNNFSNGGWDTFFQVTQNSQNNPYGAYLNTKNQLYAEVGTQNQKYTKQLEWGKGILSYEKCKPGTEQQAGAATNGNGVLNNAPTVQCQTWDYTKTPPVCSKYYDVKEENVDTGIAVGDCSPSNKETVTPGSVIEGQMQNVFGSSVKQLEVSDEINEIISALLNQMTNTLIGGIGKGLRGLTQKNATTPRTFVDQISQGSEETKVEDDQTTNTIQEGVVEFRDVVQEAGDSVRQTSQTPVLVLNGDSPMYIYTGTTFNDPGADVYDPVTNTTITIISSDNNIDTYTPNTYTLNYQFTSQGGLSSNSIQRTVIVQ